MLKHVPSVMTTDGEGQSNRIEKELLGRLKAKKDHKKIFEKANLKTFDDDEDDFDENSSQGTRTVFIICESLSNFSLKRTKFLIFKYNNLYL